MTEDEAEQWIRSNVAVTRMDVTLAKTFILANHRSSVDTTIADFLKHADAVMPQQVIVHPSVDTLSAIRTVARSISLRLAAIEAFWELISSASLMPASTRLYGGTISVDYTTVMPGSGGRSGGWTFGEFDLKVFDICLRPHSPKAALPLTDGDLFVAKLGIKELHPEIDQAVREALRCFKHELYEACLAMLGKAGEGAWVESGVALADFLCTVHPVRGKKLRDDLLSPVNGIARKVPLITKSYENVEVFGAVHTASGVKPGQLMEVVVWTDVLRDARNVVHFRAVPAMANTYDKVAILIISSVSSLRTLYRVREATRERVRHHCA